ncbi:MAG: gluconeogenesis factor YvcK family protein [Chloroflexota bacterium]
MSNPIRVVAVGGGGGASQVLAAAQSFTDHLTAVIAVTDTGRSTGLARAISDIPAPGDLRATIASFSHDELIARLLQHRLSGSGVRQLEGMAFGNLLIAVLSEVLGDFASAVEYVAQMAGTNVRVLPVATESTHLCAELADGTIVEGELEVRGLDKPPIERVFLRDIAPAYAPALEAIREADVIVLGPGSLFTSILANLIFPGISEAIHMSKGHVVYICNTTTQPGQTDGFRAYDHIKWITQTLGPGILDTVLINRSSPDPESLRQYEEEGLFLLCPEDEEIAMIDKLGVQPIVRDFSEQVGSKRALWNKQDTVRHNIETLGETLYELATASVSERS